MGWEKKNPKSLLRQNSQKVLAPLLAHVAGGYHMAQHRIEHSITIDSAVGQSCSRGWHPGFDPYKAQVLTTMDARQILLLQYCGLCP